MRLIAVASLWSCVAFSQPRKVTTLQGETMGTTYSIKVSSSTPLPFNLKQKVDLLLVGLNKKLSTYITTSEISKFNQLPAMSKHTASKEMLENFEISKKVHRLSSGAFEPTISNLVDLWGFGKPAAGTPKHSQIKAAMLHIGITKIRQTADTLIKTDDKIRLDFSGVAKGYAVDKIAGYMYLHGITGTNKIFYTTGRLTSEMVIKTVQMGIPILVSRSGFTAWGVDLAREAELTLIGRAKGERFIVLSGEQRIIYD